MLNKIFHLTLGQLLLMAFAVIVLVLVITIKFWHQAYYPARPLYVELYNKTDTLIPSVVIEHGNLKLQERIQTFQLRPSERRIVMLNHQPGQGFNIEAHLTNGEKLAICAGKLSTRWFIRESISAVGIYTTDIR